ncbi:unnamed protein product [Cuscuta campestris]|uniref:Uncharacterized protein n=1 Tax=Cuscuta campestris TaxID=132261 RepID=A0A484LCD4_9ASTE|nr:unnamed protein product [Cuscuta campestris]
MTKKKKSSRKRNHRKRKRKRKRDFPKKWRTLKDHPIENVIGDIRQGVSTSNSLRDTINHMAFVSQIEPTTILDAINDEHWSIRASTVATSLIGCPSVGSTIKMSSSTSLNIPFFQW